MVNTQKLPVMDVTLNKQSGISSQKVGPSFEKKAIVSYSDFNSNTQTVESMPDASFDMAQSGDADFPNWFERPVRIRDVDWAVNGSISQTFHPWNLWAKDPKIANRLTNYRNFRGKLHVKFTINGNQFYWGRLLCSYNPYNTLTGTNSYTQPSGLVQCSQRPHVYLDPASSTGGELVLPFFHPYNAIDLTKSGTLDDMGEIELNSIGLLRKMNGTQAVSVTVWAWCEDVVLSGPTQINIDGITAQMAIDEYGSGPVSKPASAVASLAGKLSKVPVIGPYAMATQIGAASLGKIAALFGYSRPTVITEPCLNSPLPTGNMAQVDAPDTSRSMALTSKQEVTVDPRTTGLGGTDELDISGLCERESFYTTFLWDYADTTGSLLWNCGVSPMTTTSVVAGEYDLSPMSFAALPFRYWCGSITYRFQVIASGYHKGRLMFCWDPIRSAPTGSLISHTKYTHVVDIAEERDFEITVGWGSDRPALEIPLIDALNNDLNVAVFNTDNFNGALAVYVLNDLVTSQDTTDPVSLAVSVKSHDMHYYAPHEARLEDLSYHNPTLVNLANIEAQADIEQTDANQMEGEAIQPEGDNELVDMGSTGISAMQVPFCAGEQITSFRQCIKRYSQHAIHGGYLGGSASKFESFAYYVHKQPAFPYMFGYEPGGVDTDTLGANVNECTFTLLDYLAPAYAGWRGSLRWKITPIQAPCCSWMLEAKRCGSNCNYEDNFNYFNQDNFGNSNPKLFTSAIRKELQADIQGGWDGIVTTATQHNPVLEFSIPYYNNRRFMTLPRNTALDSSEGMGWWIRFTNTGQGTQSTASGTGDGAPNTPAKSIILNSYVAAGEDFSFFFFRGVPRLYLTVL